MTWNQEGLRGLPGPKGVAGETVGGGEDGIDGEDGVDGDDGDDGVDGIDGTDGTDATVTWKYVVTAVCQWPADRHRRPSRTRTCAAPTPNAVNGGVQLAGSPRAVRVIATAPVGGPPRLRRGTCSSRTTGTATTVKTWVLCSNGTNLP